MTGDNVTPATSNPQGLGLVVRTYIYGNFYRNAEQRSFMSAKTKLLWTGVFTCVAALILYYLYILTAYDRIDASTIHSLELVVRLNEGNEQRIDLLPHLKALHIDNLKMHRFQAKTYQRTNTHLIHMVAKGDAYELFLDVEFLKDRRLERASIFCPMERSTERIQCEELGDLIRSLPDVQLLRDKADALDNSKGR
jgi:hypothetical protein